MSKVLKLYFSLTMMAKFHTHTKQYVQIINENISLCMSIVRYKIVKTMTIR